jgi:hypothetical protein
MLRSKHRDFQKYADSVIAQSNILMPALVGTSMALPLMGKVFDSYGYTFSTVAPSIVLILSLWIPILQNRALFKKGRLD